MLVEKLKLTFVAFLLFLLNLLMFGCSTSQITKYELGLESYTNGRYRTAIEYFTRAIWEDPVNAELYFLRGNAKAKLELNNEAILDYTTAIKLDPKMKFYENRGLTFIEIEDYRNAISDFNETLVFDSTNSTLYFNRGYTYALEGNYESAIKDYSRAISHDSTKAKVFVNRGDLWSGVGENQKAIFDFTSAISLNNKDELAYFNRAKEFAKIGMIEQAIDDYSKAILLSPSKVEYYFLRAELKVGTAEFLSAAADYTKIISMEPDNGNAFYNRGICYANISLKDNACDDLNRAGELGFFEAYDVIRKFCLKEEKKKKK
ncbi:MAG: tetratricopeptide repeat protein [Bacteroidetes bacterium]|nr:tetratricopeptide repeat protein [Bacteroidota bacterium]